MGCIAFLSNGDIVIGLEEENIKRMREGRPFSTNLGDIGGPPLRISIVVGKDLDDLKAMMADGMRPETAIIDKTTPPTKH